MTETLSIYEFMQRFPDEKAARKYLESKRWGEAIICPFCGSVHIQTRKLEGYYRCLDCKQDFTVRTGTIFERSHVALNKWLFAIYQVVIARKGISSVQLAGEIGVTQKTSWFMLQRIREALSDDNYKLEGIIEADGTYIGGKETNKHDSRKLNAGRGSVGKTCVLGMRERNGNVKGAVIDSTDKETVHSVLSESIDPAATIVTDEHASYKGIANNHLIVNHKVREFVNGMASTNGIESVWAVVKQGYYGIYHSFSRKHLQRYIDEFMFRMNEGNIENPVYHSIGSVFEKAIGKRLTYRQLVGEPA